jgi:hypothetical protein
VKDVATIVVLVLFNVICVWVLFLGGADRLEGLGSYGWQNRLWSKVNAPGSAPAFKLLAGALLVFEVIVITAAVIHG